MGILFTIVVLLALGLWLLGPKLLWRSIQTVRNSIHRHVSDAVGETPVTKDQPHPMNSEALAAKEWIARGGPGINKAPLCDQGECMGKTFLEDPDCRCNMRFHQNIKGYWYRIDSDDKGGYKAVLVR